MPCRGMGSGWSVPSQPPPAVQLCQPRSSKKQTPKQEEMSAGSLGKCLEAKVEVEVGDLRPPGGSVLHKRWEEGK